MFISGYKSPTPKASNVATKNMRTTRRLAIRICFGVNILNILKKDFILILSRYSLLRFLSMQLTEQDFQNAPEALKAELKE